MGSHFWPFKHVILEIEEAGCDGWYAITVYQIPVPFCKNIAINDRLKQGEASPEAKVLCSQLHNGLSSWTTSPSPEKKKKIPSIQIPLLKLRGVWSGLLPCDHTYQLTATDLNKKSVRIAQMYCSVGIFCCRCFIFCKSSQEKKQRDKPPIFLFLWTSENRLSHIRSYVLVVEQTAQSRKGKGSRGQWLLVYLSVDMGNVAGILWNWMWGLAASFALEYYTINREMLQGHARKDCCIIACVRERQRAGELWRGGASHSLQLFSSYTMHTHTLICLTFTFFPLTHRSVI